MTGVSKKDIESIRNSGLFDEKWYLEQYPDVKELGMDPAEHYLWIGSKLGRSGSKSDGAGLKEGNSDSGSVDRNLDKDISIEENVDINFNNIQIDKLQIDRIRVEQSSAAIQKNLFSRHAEVRILKHNLSNLKASQAAMETCALAVFRNTYSKGGALRSLFGNRKGDLKRSGLVDENWYLDTYVDVKEAGADAVEHYFRFGVLEGRNPNSHFDTAWYLVNNPEVIVEGQNPILHYHEKGWKEHRNPSPRFDTASYINAFPEVVSDAGNPLAHFLTKVRSSLLRSDDFPVAPPPTLDSTVRPVPIEAPYGAREFKAAEPFIAFRENHPENKFADLKRFHAVSPTYLPPTDDDPLPSLQLVPLLRTGNFIEISCPQPYPLSRILRVEINLRTVEAGRVAVRYATKNDPTYDDQKCQYCEVPEGKSQISFLLGSDHLNGPLRIELNVPGAVWVYSISLKVAPRTHTPEPTMSFIIPCYNHGEFVEETIESIRQISENERYEIIIVDDGSTDIGCVAILDRLANDGDVSLIRQANQGLGAARNNGIRRSRGRYILPVDADNRIRPAYFYRSVEIFETDPEIGVVYSNVQFFGVENRRRILKKHSVSDQFVQNRIDACAAFRREVWEQTGGYQEQMIGYQDWEFWAAIDSLNYWKYYHLNDIGFEYRVLPGSMVTHTRKFHEEIVDYIGARHIRNLRKSHQTLLRRVESASSRSDELGSPIILSNYREKSPLVSIIAPNYNKEKYLNTRLDSIYKQTYRNFEVIILDDNSSDNSKNVIKNYEGRGETSHVVFNTNNSGNVFHQWRKGIELAQGEIIWIAECDDYCSANFLERLVPHLTSSFNIGVAYAQSNYVDEEGRIFGNHIKNLKGLDPHLWSSDFVMEGVEFVRRFLRKMNCLPNASGIIFRRELAELIDWKTVTSYSVCGDWWIWAKFLQNTNLHFQSEALNYFRFDNKTARSKASQDLSRVREHFRILSMINDDIGLSIHQREDAVRGFVLRLQRHLMDHGADEKELMGLLGDVYKLGGDVSVRMPGVPLSPE